MTPARRLAILRSASFDQAWLAAMLAAVLLAAAPAWPQQEAAAPAATASDAERIIVSHGISAFGDLKYPKDFPHFDYVNPDAPQGGSMERSRARDRGWHSGWADWRRSGRSWSECS